MKKIMLLVLLPLVILCVTGCDWCAIQGRYGDGICDENCQKPDPDCADECAQNGLYGDGHCDDWCPQPDPDCGMSWTTTTSNTTNSTTTIGGSMLGAPCSSKADCGSDGICVTNFPGGYCSKECASNQDCGGEGWCYAVTDNQGTVYRCLDGCTNSGECRQGYDCMTFDSAYPTYCWPSSGGTTTITSTTTTAGGGSTTTTTIDTSGQRFQDNGNGTVTDARTGRIWLKNANPCPGPQGYGVTWAEADAYCSSLASGADGLSDGSVAGTWRLPSLYELEGIGTDPPGHYYNFGMCPYGICPNMPLWTMPGEPFTNVQLQSYWTDTGYNIYPNDVYVVAAKTGWLSAILKDEDACVWCVHGSDQPLRFNDNGNGTVTDTRTGLVWLKDAHSHEFNMDWDETNAYCSSLASGAGGLSDGSVAGQWRLPSLAELEGLGTAEPTSVWYDGPPPTGVNWIVPGEPFRNVSDYLYWSSDIAPENSATHAKDDIALCWINGGGASRDSKDSSYPRAWPVRNGN
jgi:formylglycine-generating enzyme required for sulfatase activity